MKRKEEKSQESNLGCWTPKLQERIGTMANDQVEQKIIQGVLKVIGFSWYEVTLEISFIKMTNAEGKNEKNKKKKLLTWCVF